MITEHFYLVERGVKNPSSIAMDVRYFTGTVTAKFDRQNGSAETSFEYIPYVWKCVRTTYLLHFHSYGVLRSQYVNALEPQRLKRRLR